MAVLSLYLRAPRQLVEAIDIVALDLEGVVPVGSFLEQRCQLGGQFGAVEVRVHGVRRRRLRQLQADGDGCARRGRGRSSAGRHGGQRPGNQARRRGARDGSQHCLVHELPQVHPLAQAGLMNAEATRQELIAAQ